MRSKKMKMIKRFKSKRGGSSKSTTCKGRLKGKGNPKCEDSSGCKWIPKKGKVKGHCINHTQSSNSKKSIKATKNSVNTTRANSKKSVKATKNSVNATRANSEVVAPEEERRINLENYPMNIGLDSPSPPLTREEWNDTHHLPKKGTKLTKNDKIVIKKMDFYKKLDNAKQRNIDVKLNEFKYKLHVDIPFEEWMDDYDDYSETFIQAVYKAMKGTL
tara:strand:+ start:107 stop:757 length:651 start_codon:yes stop_codon:yes gene_type:complete